MKYSISKSVAVFGLVSVLFLGCSGGGSTGAPVPLKSSDPCINAASKWALWTNGACLRGANIGLSVRDAVDTWPDLVGPPYTQVDFDNLAAMGANVVNISGPGLWTQTPPYQLDLQVQASLDNILAMIQKANMFAVITARMGPGRLELDFQTAKPAVVWTDAAAQQGWVDMWRYMANRYKNNPIVIGYDLMVEPNANTVQFQPATLDTPGLFYPQYANTLYDWNPLAKKITGAIRLVDKDTPILVGGMGYSAATWLGAIVSTGDSKTVYMAHQYEPQALYTHQPAPYANTYGTSSGTFTRADLLTQFAYLASFKAARGVPVGVNEFGGMRFQPGMDQFLNDEMDLFETNGINYSIWLWETSWAGLTYDQFNYRRGMDPNNHIDVSPNPLTTVIKKYFRKNTVFPLNRSY